MLIILVALALVLNLFPQIQNNSLIIAVGFLSGLIELYGFVRDRTSKEEKQSRDDSILIKNDPVKIQQKDEYTHGPHTIVTGNVQGQMLSGHFDGPSAASGNAMDMRGAVGSINEAKGFVSQHFGDKVIQIIPSPEKQLIPRIQPPPKDFVGRESDIKEILVKFDRGATITGIRGMGGVGKTALALILADKLKDRYPDGQIFLDLQGTSKEPLATVEAMAYVIRCYIGPDAKLPEDLNGLQGIYNSVLSGKRTLILLDNAFSREQVEPLLPPEGSALLITSRNKFALPGLKEKDLNILRLEDAKKLLLEVEGRIGEHAEELANLCGRLPLALRNAAYALKERQNIKVADYVKRLENARERLDLVEASFNLSYELLSPESKRLWCLLSVFPAGFELEGAEAVLEIEKNSAEDTLGELVKWSLVDFLPATTSKEGRYHLHDLARDFATSRLEAKDKANAQLRHAAYYLSILWRANELLLEGSQSSQMGLYLFDSEWSNIKIAQSWAQANSASSPYIAEICSNFAWTWSMLDLRLHPQNYINWIEAALVCAQQLRNLEAEVAHLINLGVTHADLGDSHKAIECYKRALVIAHEMGDRMGEGKVYGNIGNAYVNLGYVRKAIECYERHLSIARELGDKRGEGADLGNIGNAYAALGDNRKAIEYNERALDIAHELGDKRAEENALGSLGNACANLGDTQNAIEYYRKALAIAHEIGDKKGEGIGFDNLGIAYVELSDYRKAIVLFEKALAIAREIGDKRGEGNILGNIGTVYKELGDAHKAIDYYEQHLAIARKIGDRRGEGKALFNISLSLDSLGERTKAIDLAKSAFEAYEEIESSHAEKVKEQLRRWQE